jgi:hypothetical protein
MSEVVYQLSEQDMITVFKLRIVNEILCHACDMLDLDDAVGQIENEYIQGYAKAHGLDKRQLTLTDIACMELKESSYKPIRINQDDPKSQFPN